MLGASINSFTGIKVTASPLVPEFSTFSNRKHNRRKGSAAYHRRIQKKWDKRFGVRKERYFIEMGALGIFAHPNTIRLLEQTIQKHANADFERALYSGAASTANSRSKTE